MTFAASELPATAGPVAVAVIATDAGGNVCRIEGVVIVDRAAGTLTLAPDTADGTPASSGSARGDAGIDGAERLSGGGIRLTGTAGARAAAVMVALDGVEVVASLDAAGAWAASFAAHQVARCGHDATVIVTAMDEAGAIDSWSDTVRIRGEVTRFCPAPRRGGTDPMTDAA